MQCNASVCFTAISLDWVLVELLWWLLALRFPSAGSIVLSGYVQYLVIAQVRLKGSSHMKLA